VLIVSQEGILPDLNACIYNDYKKHTRRRDHISVRLSPFVVDFFLDLVVQVHIEIIRTFEFFPCVADLIEVSNEPSISEVGLFTLPAFEETSTPDSDENAVQRVQGRVQAIEVGFCIHLDQVLNILNDEKD